MKSVIAGGSGFIGEALVRELNTRGEVIVLSRNPERVKEGRGVSWNPPLRGEWEREIDGADVVVNLAGENIAGERWSEERKKELLSSRVEPTSALVTAIEAAEKRPSVFISASATGYYGDRKDELLDESASPGNDFLSTLAQAWEGAAAGAASFTRVANPRFGVVMAKEGGMLQRLLPLFKLHAGGKLGSGKQWMSWISRRDAIALIVWLIDHPGASGAYNATSPEPVTNAQFTRSLASVLGKSAIFAAPAFPLRLAMGEMADALLFASQRAVPARARAEGFVFRDATLDAALAAELR